MKLFFYIMSGLWGVSFLLRALANEEWHDQYIIGQIFFIAAVLIDKIEDSA